MRSAQHLNTKAHCDPLLTSQQRSLSPPAHPSLAGCQSLGSSAPSHNPLHCPLTLTFSAKFFSRRKTARLSHKPLFLLILEMLQMLSRNIILSISSWSPQRDKERV